MGPIRKKWPKTASNTLYRLKTWVQSRHRENLKSNAEIGARCRFRIHIFDRLKVFLGRLDQFFGPRSSGAWLQWHLCKKNGSNRPRLAPAAGKLAKSQHRASMLCKPKTLDPDFSRIRQKFKILIQLKVLDFGSNSKTTKKSKYEGVPKRAKKSALVVCSFNFYINVKVFFSISIDCCFTEYQIFLHCPQIEQKYSDHYNEDQGSPY